MPILGMWYNELGSMLEIASASNGALVGTYCSAVGQAQFTYALSGRCDAAPSPGGKSLGWTVAWMNEHGNAHSTTSWAGQYQTDPKTGSEQIYTFWLLVTEEPSNKDWAATNVGQDTFTRVPPDMVKVEQARKRPASQPFANTPRT